MGIIAARDALHIRHEICVDSGIPHTGIGVHILGYKRDDRKGEWGRTISRSTNCSSILRTIGKSAGLTELKEAPLSAEDWIDLMVGVCV